MIAQGNPIKKVKIEQSTNQEGFYVIKNKVIIFTQIANFPDLSNFLNNIAEPISKPAHINEFQISKSSLLRAKALGYTSTQIFKYFQNYMINPPLSHQLKQLVYQVLDSQPLTKLYLKQTAQRNFYIFQHSVKFTLPHNMVQFYLHSKIQQQNNHQIQKIIKWRVKEQLHNELARVLFQKQIPVLCQNVIDKKQCQSKIRKHTDLLDPNKGDLHCKNLKIQLKAFTKLRQYQIECLKAVVFQAENQKKAKSGYIVLPCGAGKTLLGISICTKIQKQSLIVCSSDSGAQQWKRQIQKWTQGVSKNQIKILTSKTAQDIPLKVYQKQPSIYISTYSHLKAKLQSKDKQIKSQYLWLKRMPWGLIVFDEAQWLPAKGNSEIANSLIAHVKIGLTATPLREDENIKSLNYIIGPQLYVGSWRKFVQCGYLASPKCVEIRTKLSLEFRRIYQQAKQMKNKDKQRQTIYQCNPNKIRTLMYLLKYHKNLNDQIIVFCDRISIINFLAVNLEVPLLSGKTSIEDRNFVFDMFREGKYKILLLSRIGDQAIDLPNANVAIQINIHKGSRRQMLQRLGRIMRPKETSSPTMYNAVFYTIVTDNTLQMNYFNKRRQCLVNLGFQYDLRFSEYEEPNIVNIYPNKKQKDQYYLQMDRQFKNLIPREREFWDKMRIERQE